METAFLCTVLIAFLSVVSSSTEVYDNMQNEPNVIPLNTTDDEGHLIPRDLYLIRTIVYEVGILTDASNETDDSTDTQEQVSLTFYNPAHNGTFINLDKIPIPYLRNIHGQVITNIIPVNVGPVKINTSEAPHPDALEIEMTTDAPISQTSTSSEISVNNLEAERNILENLPVELLVK